MVRLYSHFLKGRVPEQNKSERAFNYKFWLKTMFRWSCIWESGVEHDESVWAYNYKSFALRRCSCTFLKMYCNSLKNVICKPGQLATRGCPFEGGVIEGSSRWALALTHMPRPHMHRFNFSIISHNCRWGPNVFSHKYDFHESCTSADATSLTVRIV